jgi:hypothetical protein
MEMEPNLSRSSLQILSKRGADIDTIKSITGASDQMIKDVLG